jgi:hypothetical protein
MSSAAARQAIPIRPAAEAFPSLVLQRKCACGASASSLTGECEGCGKRKLGIQRRLAIGATDDPLELEAGRIADQVMAMPTRSTLDKVPLRIQRFSGSSTGREEVAPPSVDEVLSTPGSPLDRPLREDMEQRFGYDFSQVRVHTDAAAQQSARDVNAHAYTVGNDLVFGRDQYAPESRSGRHLLAHELAHMVQQRAGTRGTVQRQGTKVDVSIRAEGECKAPKSIALAAAWGGRMVRTALDWFLYSADDEVNLRILNANLRANFGSDSDATRTAVHDRLAQVSSYLESAQRAGLTFNCLEGSDPVCGKHVAEAGPGAARIKLCPSWFSEFDDYGINYGGYSLIHECAHIAGAVEKNEVYQSKIYGGLSAEECLKPRAVGSNPLNNADNYGWFVSCLALPSGTEVYTGLTIEGHSTPPGKKRQQPTPKVSE